MRIFVSIVTVFSCLFMQAQEADGWTLKKSENDVKVYSRSTPESAVKELMSVAIVTCSLKSLVAVIDDWENYSQWVYKCGVSSTLKKFDETEGIHYQTVLVPWPADDRDFVVNIKVSQDEKTGVVNVKTTNKPDYIPEKKDHVRVKILGASWTLIPLKDGTVKVINKIHVDPGGNVPAWLVNMAAVDGPYETMVNLKKMADKKQYKEAKVDYIKEPVASVAGN